jgi:small acid-soluble spore protein L (minor)
VVHVEKQHSAGRGRLTGGVTPQGDIVLNRDNRHTDPKTELENRAKKSNTKH